MVYGRLIRLHCGPWVEQAFQCPQNVVDEYARFVDPAFPCKLGAEPGSGGLECRKTSDSYHMSWGSICCVCMRQDLESNWDCDMAVDDVLRNVLPGHHAVIGEEITDHMNRDWITLDCEALKLLWYLENLILH